MKTVITDKDNIVLGFGEAVVDPEASKPVINEILLSSQEATTVAEKKNLINAKNKLANDAYNLAVSAHRIAMQAQEDGKATNDPVKKAEHAATYKNRIAARDIKNNEYSNHMTYAQAILDEELKPALKLLGGKQKELWQSGPVVYFEPKKGEHVLTGSEHAALTSQYPIPAEKVLQFDPATKAGAIIDNLVGVVYFVDNAGTWETGTIEFIGDALPTGAIRQADLTTEQRTSIELQFETERVAGLTQAEKDAEKAIAINAATAQSVHLRSQYEIEGRTDPLADAQAWLDAEIVKIEAKYV
jgi:hypothetical protein